MRPLTTDKHPIILGCNGQSAALIGNHFPVDLARGCS
jgi:hypothetical protein